MSELSEDQKKAVMDAYLASLGGGTPPPENHRKKGWLRLKEGEAVDVKLPDPRFVRHKKNAGQANSKSGFAKGEVTRQNLDN